MSDTHLLIVDWTGGAPRLQVFEMNQHLNRSLQLSLPARVVLRNESTHLSVISGEEAQGITESPQTIIFENPAAALAATAEPELIRLLVEGFWSSLANGLSSYGEFNNKQFATYVVTPANYSTAVMQSLQAEARKYPFFRLLGCIQEAAALIMGVLRAVDFDQYESTLPNKTISLVVACDEQTIDVVCFDYASTSPTRRKILIRDCFATTCADLAKRLYECDWLGAFSQLVIIEHPELSVSARAAIEWPFQAIADSEIMKREVLTAASELRILGGAYVGLCAARRAPDEREYDLASAWNVGLQIDQEYFQPILIKDSCTPESEFPAFATHAFSLDGTPGALLRLNFCAGYSRRVADAITLGSTVLNRAELDRLSGSKVLAATARLDEAGTGEFRIGVMPENSLLRRHTFTLPGLIF